MNQLDAMQVFVRVAELASFTRAADSLGLPKASASTAVQQLENLLGTRLLHRTTRKVQTTQDGQAFYERCKDLLADVDELRGMFQQAPQALRGRLRVDMPSGMAHALVIPRLPEFLALHPQLELELSSADRRVDLVREGFDCVVRIGTLADSSLIARPLGQFRVANCASPAYLQRYGTPRRLQDLAGHRLVHYAASLGGRPDGWEYWDGAAYRSLPMAGVLTVNNVEAYRTACLVGLGLIQAPLIGLEPYLARGELVEVLPELSAEPMPVSLLYAHRRNLPQRAQVFMQWMAELLQPYLDPPG
ncbi:LysR family transcriptional regulator [Lysobacter sp. Root983]|uniref:LysR family transcriptional regulator n=1 Tax=Lysobacter sp. Root983 TaxID=1736613 RepID=UPI00070CCBD6|nr:LysR family transcriptional regulator [Lysobacter sp. Root983]KRD75907.1 transcriptional regulator [Lysobacter sp. Root983]